MPSRTIRPTEAPAAAPFAYTVGTADGLAGEAVFASWDGSGASGDFLPCVSYYNSEGVLLDRAFPDGVTMTPGDTAEVSYRPFNRSGGTSTPPPVSVPAVARAHVTGGSFTVTGNDAQVPITADFLQNVSFAPNAFVVDVSGWYLLVGLGGWTRHGPGAVRDRIAWIMNVLPAGEGGGSLVTVESSLIAGQFVQGNEAIATPTFLQAGDTVTVSASITTQFGVTSALGSLDVVGYFGLYQMA